MSRVPPPPIPRARRPGRGEALADLAIAALGVVLVATIVVQAPPRELTWVWVVAGYTVLGVLATLVLAGARVATRRLPPLIETTLDGEPALRVRAWGVQWWYDQTVDAGLGLTGWTLAVLAFRTDDMPGVGVPLAVAATWFLARVGLGLAGRRFRRALWITPSHLVLDGPSGRVRCPRDAVRRVHGGSRVLVISLATSAEWQPCPRPWRRGGTPGTRVTFDCSETAYRAEDLADWVRPVNPAGPPPRG